VSSHHKRPRKVFRQARQSSNEFQLTAGGRPVSDGYEWLNYVQQHHPDLGQCERDIVNAAAIAADPTGYVTEDRLFDAMERLGTPVTDRHKAATWTVG
jgi:hypothetical protein